MAQKRSTNKAQQRTQAAQAKVTNAEESAAKKPAPKKPAAKKAPAKKPLPVVPTTKQGMRIPADHPRAAADKAARAAKKPTPTPRPARTPRPTNTKNQDDLAKKILSGEVDIKELKGRTARGGRPVAHAPLGDTFRPKTADPNAFSKKRKR